MSQSLQITWSFDAAKEPLIVGFRLYKDGNIASVPTIPSNMRVVAFPREEDNKPHTYHIVTYSVDGTESLASNTVIDIPPVSVSPPVTAVTLQVVENE